MKILLLALVLLMPACQLGQTTAGKADQLVGLILQYDPDSSTPDALALAALNLLGYDQATLDAIVPSQTALLFAEKLVAKEPDLAPLQALIAKLYHLALYGPPLP